MELAADCQWRVAEAAGGGGLLRQLGCALTNLTACYQDVGQWQEASHITSMAVLLAVQLDDVRSVANLADHFGFTYGYEGRVDDALRLWALALALARRFSMPRRVAFYTARLAEILVDHGRYAEAARILREGWDTLPTARVFAGTLMHVVRRRLRHETGRASAGETRDDLLAPLGHLGEPESRALVLYSVWRTSKSRDDHAAAERAVAEILRRHPHVRWQRHYARLTGETRALPRLPPPRPWLVAMAPSPRDAEARLFAYAERLRLPVATDADHTLREA